MSEDGTSIVVVNDVTGRVEGRQNKTSRRYLGTYATLRAQQQHLFANHSLSD